MLRFLPKFRSIFVSLIGGFALTASAVRSDAQDFRYLSAQSWSTVEGLPQSSVHSIAQTSDGYIWAATEAGLARFDGSRFDVFEKRTEPAFTSNDVCCLVADSASGLWIGTSDGLLHLDHGRFIRYALADGLPSSEIVGLARRGDGILEVSTSAGSVRWSEGDHHSAPLPLPATTGAWDSHSLSPSWSWTAKSVQFQRGLAKQSWQAERELPPGRVSAFQVDRGGLAWVGMTSGLVVIDSAKQKVTRIPAFTGSPILCIFQDREGSYWIGTESSGLHILRPLRFRGIPALAGKAITSVVGTNDGATWIGTREDGVYRVKGETVEERISAGALTSAVILCLQLSIDGGVWIGTPDGLNYISAGYAVRQITSANGLPDDYVRSLIAVPDGSIWVGTRHGLVHMRGSHLETLTSKDGLGGDLIGSMLLEPSAGPTLPAGLWVATSGGLSRIAANGDITNFTAKDGLTTPIVTALNYDPSGRLWVATEDGTLAVFSGRRFQRVFDLARGGSGSDNIQAITMDAAQSLWVRLNRGILRIAPSQLEDCLKKSPCKLQDDFVAQYGPADGLRNDEVVPRATAIPWLATNGELWFPTRSGVAIAQTHIADVTSTGPPVVLQGFLVDDFAMDIAHGAPQVPFGHQRLTMEYAALSFIAPSGMHYRYRLEGFEREWRQVGNIRSATYTSLAPGSYIFQVQARNNDGVWGVKGADLRFRIVPPIYRRWWFLTLVALVMMAIVFGLIQLRLHRMKNQFDAVLAERTRMAREIHDTLTQDFVSTSLQLDIIAQQLGRGHVEQGMEQVRRARQMVTDGLAEARQSIWELRASHSHDPLPTRLSRLLQREAFTAIHPQFQVRGAYRAADARVEREILRLVNEALLNVVRHAQSHSTSVELYYSTETLMLTIEDDGLGFDVDKALHMEGHYGLEGMKERAEIIDGTLTISSEAGRGTTVMLRIPLIQSTSE